MNPYRVLWIKDLDRPAQESPDPAAWRVDPRAASDAVECVRQFRYDAVVLDFPIPGCRPDDLLEAVRRAAPSLPVLIRDPDATPQNAVRLARLGAWQFLTEEPSTWAAVSEAIRERSRGELAALAQNVAQADWQRLLIGQSSAMRQVSHIIEMVGSRRATVLITGETGTGKELAARALHLAGPRRKGPWVAVNCSALPENLLEDELFGHVRGAFTGAVQARTGRFEQAQGGTLFLDEIGEMALDLQAKLLRVLQEREFQRLGSSETIRADVRVAAATNCDLAARVEQGRFREDLYYRLNVVPLHMPPLRLRRGDIPLLAAHFVEKICRLEEIPVKTLTPEAVDRLTGCPWPGNVRQLENAVEMAVALSGSRAVLMAADFPAPQAPVRAPAVAELPTVAVPDDGLDFERTLALIERSILQQALEKTGGNKKAAADMLRLKRTTLSAKVRSLESVA